MRGTATGTVAANSSPAPPGPGRAAGFPHPEVEPLAMSRVDQRSGRIVVNDGWSKKTTPWNKSITCEALSKPCRSRGNEAQIVGQSKTPHVHPPQCYGGRVVSSGVENAACSSICWFCWFLEPTRCEKCPIGWNRCGDKFLNYTLRPLSDWLILASSGIVRGGET